jgi:hypothetical protein
MVQMTVPPVMIVTFPVGVPAYCGATVTVSRSACSRP